MFATGTATALTASTSAADLPADSSTVVAAGSSRWIDQSGTPWLDEYHVRFLMKPPVSLPVRPGKQPRRPAVLPSRYAFTR